MQEPASWYDDLTARGLQNDRETERRKFFRNEGIPVKISVCNAELNGEIIDLSPFGAGIALPIETEASLLNKGDAISLCTNYADNSDSDMEFTGIVVRTAVERDEVSSFLRAGISFCLPADPSISQIGDRRRARRFRCPEFFEPLAWAHHPWFFCENVHFRVIELSATGLRMICSARNKGLIRGLKLTLSVAFPMSGEVEVDIIIRNVRRISNNARYQIHAQLLAPSPAYLHAAADFLATSQRGVSFRDLRSAGFKLESIGHALTFSYADTEERLAEVLKLRLQVYQAKGEFADVDDPRIMLDAIDEYARNFLISVGGEPVAAGRLTLKISDPAQCETAQFVDLPAWLWEAGFCEVSRIVVHSGFRGGEVFITLLVNIARIAHQNRVPYIVFNCEDSLVERYKTVGGKELGLDFHWPPSAPDGTPCHAHAMYFDVKEFMQAKGVHPLVWGGTFGQMATFLHRTRQLRLTLRARLSLLAFQCVKFIMVSILGKKSLIRDSQHARSRLNKPEPQTAVGD